MNDTANSSTRRPTLFISYALDDDKVRRKAAFEKSILDLLSQRTEDFVSSMNADHVMTALQVDAASSLEEPTEANCAHVGASPAQDARDERMEFSTGSHLAPKSAGSAHASTRSATTLQGRHNAEALSAGCELVDIAARRPACGIWQSLSGKGGSGKTAILLHLACLAHRRSDMKVAMIDLGADQITAGAPEGSFADVGNADLILIDNAQRAPRGWRATDWWAQFARHLAKSACVLVSFTPNATGSANEPWRVHADVWRETEIGAFDYEFRRALVQQMSEQRAMTTGMADIPEDAIKRLAEELWGNGWQLAAAVEAYVAFRNVMARPPTYDEVDVIAANVSASPDQRATSLATISNAIDRAWDRSHAMRSDLVLSVAKAVTGHPLQRLAGQLGLDRSSALEAMHRIERARRKDREICHSLERVESELNQRH